MNHLSEDILIEFADGTLASEQHAAAELHLADCAQCREEVKMLKSLSELLVKENLIMAPPPITNLVMQQVELHQHIMMRKAQSRKTAFRFAGIMLAFLLGFFVLGFYLAPGGTFHLPDFAKDAINYLIGKELTLKNPVILYIAVSVIILLVIERILRSIKPRKVTA